jgi:hemerythrin superfamily protein
MDALALLTADHNRVRGLFHRFKDAKERSATEEMRTLQQEIFTDLDVHTTIEEEIFYPWVTDLSEEIAETVEEGIQEHHVVKVLMGEIRGIDPGDEQFAAKMTVLIENVEHHAGEEEGELFPEVRSAADDDVLEELADRMEARKQALGAPVTADKIDLTVAELMGLAAEQKIPGRSTMDHEELAATVAPPH